MKRALASLLLLVLAGPLLPGQVREPEYRRALPPYAFEFPADHGAHPEYKLE